MSEQKRTRDEDDHERNARGKEQSITRETVEEQITENNKSSNR